LPLLLLLCLTLSLGCSGCAGTATVTPDAPAATVIVQTPAEIAQDVATKSVLSLGEVLVTAPALLKAARQSGKLSKEGYNTGVDIYNQALASYTILNQALQAAITAGKDPTSVAGYTMAMAKFLSERNLLANIITATGGA
jgi:hypothetical protein